MRFALQQVFGVEAEPVDAILSSVWDYSVAADGRVFVVDRSGHALVQFDADGQVGWRQSQSGLGPGDLLEPASVALSEIDDRLFVSNQNGRRIDVWSTGGEFIEAHAVADLGRTVAMVEGFRAPNLLLAWSPSYGHAALDAFVVDVRDWQIIREFRIESQVGFELASNYSREPDLRVTSDGVFAGSDGQYLLREFDWHGRLRRAVTRDFDLLAAPESSMQRAASVGMGDVSAPFVLPGGYWITMGRWIKNKHELEEIFERESSSLATRNSIASSYFLDVFGADGMLLGSLFWDGERPEFARFTNIDQNGDVYSKANNPFPQVRRYRVHRPTVVDSGPS